MNIEWHTASPSDSGTDAIIVFGFEDEEQPLPGLKRWIDEECPWLGGSVSFADFKGKSRQVLVCYAPAGKTPARVICAGLGKREKFELEQLRNASASALKTSRDLQLSTVAVPLTALEGLPLGSPVALEEVLTAGMTGLYRFDALKTRDLDPVSFPVTLRVVSGNQEHSDLQGISTRAQAMASGINLARDLATAPANRATPQFLTEAARSLSQRFGFSLQVLDFEMTTSVGMGAFNAVAQGTLEPPAFIVIEHCPPGTEDDPPVVFIGKGITFDTGGISLKPSANLEAMKQDMAGAAAVLGAFEVLGTLRVPTRVLGLLPCTENMPGGKAYKPGDVLKTLSGLSVEVISTDAEGRLVLCDAITYALRYEPAAIFDVATLTGACIVALGHKVAAVLGNSPKAVSAVLDAGVRAGEKYWELPLWDFYFEALKSDVADFKNVGDRSAGTIIAGMFLKQFVPDDVPWAHLDIAGTAWADKETPAQPRGATGFGVRTLVDIALRWGATP